MEKKKEKDGILDTRADEMVLDLHKRDDIYADTNSIIIETNLKEFRENTMVFAMRMNEDLLNHVKQKAREMSAKEKTDITYQMLISEAVANRYPLPKK